MDPFIKVFGTESLKRLLDNWKSPTLELDVAQSALRSSVCFGAVVALTPPEITTAFAKPKVALLAEWRLAVEQDLAKAKFLSTNDMMVIQALVIYSSLLPYANMRDIAAPIAATTVQVAMENRLHLENERDKHGDREERILLWLQICFMSSQSQVADAATSKYPVNEEDINSMDALIEKGVQNSEEQKLLVHTRLKIWHLSRQIRQLRPTESSQMSALVRAVRLDVEEEFTKVLHRNKKTELESFTEKMVQLFFTKLDHALLAQILHQQGRKKPLKDSPRHMQVARELSETSLTIIEAVHALSTQSNWASWRWQLLGSFPWRAMKLVFLQLGNCEWTPLSERAWILAKAVISKLPDEIRMDPVWPSLCCIMNNAAEHREKEMSRLTTTALLKGDYQQIIEAGSQLFYSEGISQTGDVQHNELSPNAYSRLWDSDTIAMCMSENDEALDASAMVW